MQFISKRVPLVSCALLTAASICMATPASAIIGGSSDTVSNREVVKIQTSRWICTGTLISRTLVVTAAHCLWDSSSQSYFPDLATALIGTEDGIIGRSGAVSRLVSAVKNPNYNGVDGQNDIGLIQVDDVFGGYFAEIASPAEVSASEQVFAGATASGFGVTRQDGPSSSTLLQVNQQLLEPNYCGQRWSYRIGFVSSFVCAVGTLSNTVCNGDSGGPLFINVGGKRKLIGVTNFGTTTCGLGINVFGRVTSFLSFLSENGYASPSRATPALPALPPPSQINSAPALPTRPDFESGLEKSVTLPRFSTSRIFQLILTGTSRCTIYVDGPLALRGIPTDLFIGRISATPAKRLILDEFGDTVISVLGSCTRIRQQGVFLRQVKSTVKVRAVE